MTCPNVVFDRTGLIAASEARRLGEDSGFDHQPRHEGGSFNSHRRRCCRALDPRPSRAPPARVVTVAMANKTARIVWAVLTRGDIYHPPVMA
jgi:hypothetical protein